MYTRWLYNVVIAIAVAGLMWQLAGFGDLYAGSAPGDDLESASEFEEDAERSSLATNFTGDAAPQDGNLVGLAISGIQTFVETLGFIANLPGQVLELGLPSWAAMPLGYMGFIYGSIGLVQIAAQRIFQ